jgi:hypothetical protein
MAVTLILEGVELKDVRPRPDRSNLADFYFEDIETDWLNDYDMGRMRVEPAAFALQNRKLAGLAARACKR